MGTKHIILKIRHILPHLHLFFSSLFPFIINAMAKIKKAIASIKIKINAYKAKTIPGAFSICYLSSKILNDINSDFQVSKTGI